MPYIAHSAVILHDNYRCYQKNVWQTVYDQDGLEIRWRISDGKKYEAAAGMFADKWIALRMAKNLYVAMTIQLLRRDIHMDKSALEFYGSHMANESYGDHENEIPECLFIWDEHNRGGGLGIDVYEAESIDEIDSRMSHLSVSVTQECDRDDLSKIDLCNSYFDYNQEAHSLLNTILIADNVMDPGLRMTLYCGILERLAGESFKNEVVIAEIDQLIKHVDESELSDDQKRQLRGFLESGKKESAKGKIRVLCRKYGKELYGGHKPKKMIDVAYGLRSDFSHDGFKEHDYSSEAFHMKWLVLDVLCGYLKDHQNLKIEKVD